MEKQSNNTMSLEDMFKIFFGHELFNLSTQTIMETTNFMSLYDYLGKAAGPTLGKQVFAFAKTEHQKVMTKHVNQGGFNGKVLCYDPYFLERYFTLRSKHEFDKQFFE